MDALGNKRVSDMRRMSMTNHDLNHAIGISAAADKFAEVWHDKADKYANDRQCAERIIAAYFDSFDAIAISKAEKAQLDKDRAYRKTLIDRFHDKYGEIE